MQIIDNRNELLNYFPKKMRIAELGVFAGEFSEIILRSLEPSELFLVDIFPESIVSGDKNGNNIIHMNLADHYNVLLAKYKNIPKVRIIKSNTFEFLNSLDDYYLDLVYIDADHSYNAVKSDLELSLKKVKKNGMILGHDYTNSKFPEVVKAVDEFCLEHSLKIDFLTKDGCPTFGIKL